MTISAVKPSVDPRWATNGGTRVAPTSGQQDTGWLNLQKPPHNVMNWLQGVMYDWQQYLEDATDQLESSKLNRDGTQTMTGTLVPSPTGTIDLGVATTGLWANAHIDNVRVNNTLFFNTSPNVTGNVVPTLNNTYELGSLSFGGRRWASVNGVLANFSGAATLGSTLDVTGIATMQANVVPSVDDSGTRLLGTSVAAGDAANLRWRARLSDVDTNRIKVRPPLAADTSSTARNNEIVQRNVIKAWVEINPLTGAPAPTILDGFNIASVAHSGGGSSTVDVTLASPMSSSTYGVSLSTNTFGGGGDPIIAYISSRIPNRVSVGFINAESNTIVASNVAASVGVSFTLTVLGLQP